MDYISRGLSQLCNNSTTHLGAVFSASCNILRSGGPISTNSNIKPTFHCSLNDLISHQLLPFSQKTTTTSFMFELKIIMCT
ncbi:hypothetical protein CPB83DRAFT_858433 [Crepidotus variabilis]|uniref:Uncharacterized protein n=1 Tax=Crepidotus variabilis TaxID=179855 RepID=A0A9P6EC92_9AGAR|nr:hypothetical protein CPB83DRAFT_858433 [Crepidotus variabilis]